MNRRISCRPTLTQRLRWIVVTTLRNRKMNELGFYRRIAFSASYILAIALIVSWAGERSDIVGELWPHITWGNVGVYAFWSFLAAILIATFEVVWTLIWNTFYEWYSWWSVEKWNQNHDEKATHDWSRYGIADRM